jgi:hypothetical protein
MSPGSFIVEFSFNTAAIGAASNITIHHHPIDRVRGPEPQAAVSNMLEGAPAQCRRLRRHRHLQRIRTRSGDA